MTTAIGKVDLAVVRMFSNALYEAAIQGHGVFIFGNGGSAATAAHFTSDLLHTLATSKAPTTCNIACLCSDGSLITGFANDYGYRNVFAKQIALVARPNDIAVGISASGESSSVLRGLERAKKAGAITLGLTRKARTSMRSACDISFEVASRNIYVIETVHLCFLHMLRVQLEERFVRAFAL
jgi:D-sedoheptulose 7-phosphate isomerase